MNFRVGQKVVCIDASKSWRGDISDLVKGATYTVREVFMFGVTLDEVPLPEDYLWFNGHRFRPVVERKTDISIFTKMLTDTREHVGAR